MIKGKAREYVNVDRLISKASWSVEDLVAQRPAFVIASVEALARECLTQACTGRLNTIDWSSDESLRLASLGSELIDIFNFSLTLFIYTIIILSIVAGE